MYTIQFHSLASLYPPSSMQFMLLIVSSQIMLLLSSGTSTKVKQGVVLGFSVYRYGESARMAAWSSGSHLSPLERSFSVKVLAEVRGDQLSDCYDVE